MNSFEFWAMNNPVRGLIQRFYEMPRLRRLANGPAETILEIGCGQGVGAKIIYDCFGPRKYVGVDLDPKMVSRARKKGRHLENAEFMQGDASSLDLGDDSFDLVVDFGIIHHIPNWRDALTEVHRVLKADGEFLFEELSLETWEQGIGKPLRKVLEHPYDQMFRQHEFMGQLKSLGFETESYEKKPIGFYFFWGKAAKAG